MKSKPLITSVVALALLGGAIYLKKPQVEAVDAVNPPNPNVTQENLATTVCVPGWTATIRPTLAFTTRLKTAQLFRLEGVLSPTASSTLKVRLEDYEEDHLMPLSLGGHPSGKNNLYPQPYPEARQKDLVENYLHRELCKGHITLKEAQAKVKDWPSIYKDLMSNLGSTEPLTDNDPDDI